MNKSALRPGSTPREYDGNSAFDQIQVILGLVLIIYLVTSPTIPITIENLVLLVVHMLFKFRIESTMNIKLMIQHFEAISVL